MERNVQASKLEAGWAQGGSEARIRSAYRRQRDFREWAFLCGLYWMTKRDSGSHYGVLDDAELVADSLIEVLRKDVHTTSKEIYECISV